MKEVFREELRNLTAYKPGKPIEDVKREYKLDRVYKLASNENPLGCSSNVKKAIIECMDHMGIYPDGNATLLKEKISDFTGIPTNRIFPSSGLDEFIDQVAKTFINKGDEIIMADTTFVRYKDTAQMMGGVPIAVPLKEDFTFDLDGMLNKVNKQTKLIWLCNPNNPTGTMITQQDLMAFIEKIPKNIIILYDEAYGEFAIHKDFPYNSIELLSNYENVIIMKTFSKAYGLAAFRVAYSIASVEIVKNLNKVRPAFNVNSFAQAAAIAALEDQKFIANTIENNNEGRKFFYKEFDKMNLSYIPTQTNHIWVDVDKDCQEVFIKLQQRGVIIRPMKGNNIRVSIGLPEENEFFIQCLKEVLRN